MEDFFEVFQPNPLRFEVDVFKGYLEDTKTVFRETNFLKVKKVFVFDRLVNFGGLVRFRYLKEI